LYATISTNVKLKTASHTANSTIEKNYW